MHRDEHGGVTAPGGREFLADLPFALAASLIVPMLWVGPLLRIQAVPGRDDDTLWRALAQAVSARPDVWPPSQALLPTVLATTLARDPGRAHALVVVVALILAGLGGWLVARRVGRARPALCAVCALLAQLGPWSLQAVGAADLAAMGIGALLLGVAVPPLAGVVGAWSAPVATSLACVGVVRLLLGWRQPAQRRAGAWQALALVWAFAAVGQPGVGAPGDLRAPAYVTSASAVFPLPEGEAAALRERSGRGRWVVVGAEGTSTDDVPRERTSLVLCVGTCAALGAWLGGRFGRVAAVVAVASAAASLGAPDGVVWSALSGGACVVALAMSAGVPHMTGTPRWRSDAPVAAGALLVVLLWVFSASSRGDHVVLAPDPALAPLRGGAPGDVLVFPPPEAPWRAGVAPEARWRVELAGVGRILAAGDDADAARVALSAVADVPVDIQAAARAWEVRGVRAFSSDGTGWSWLVVDTRSVSVEARSRLQAWLATRVGMPVARSPGRLLYARDALTRARSTSAPRPLQAPPLPFDPPR